MSEAKWYVVHTYSGYENKVKVDIEITKLLFNILCGVVINYQKGGDCESSRPLW